MNKTLKYLGLLAVLPLFTMALGTDYVVEDADAAKSQGKNAPDRVGAKSYGSANKSVVCGDRLCSEYPGGYEQFKKDKGQSAKIGERAEEPEVTPKTAPAPAPKTETKTETMTEKETEKPGSKLRLSRANVPAEIPLHKGWYDGAAVFFIITDSSDETHAKLITENQGWKVELAPLLKNAPKQALSKTYMFTNGVVGKGVHGFQGEVFTSTPAQAEKYSALTSHVHVTWNEGFEAKRLKSEAEILKAADEGKVTLNELSVVLNMPQIVWPDGQMKVKKDKTLTDDTPYGGAQVLEIDKENMTVTFIAHRGWGPDGRTIYYIVTDATPSGPAGMMGVTNAPTSASLIANSAAVDLFQFNNGIKGSGPLGFQAGIAASAPGDKNYSPMWRIFMIGWNDPASAAVLENVGDINFYKQEGQINVNIARPMDSDHIVNCPFIDPFQ
ncbi:MAG TPA: hypothetical protein VFG25_05715 [Nitrosopumilaceae archaeon]|nr:hypothetical protein [Nitrosopumilaceae archaeon]